MNKPAILIVEDEAIIAADLAHKLQHMGYAVAGTAATGMQAIALASQLRPALVLMDIQLAGALDGFATATAIQQVYSVPMIFLTATGGARAIESAHHCGACDFLVKPYDDLVLRAKVALALSKHDPERCLRADRPALLFPRPASAGQDRDPCPGASA